MTASIEHKVEVYDRVRVRQRAAQKRWRDEQHEIREFAKARGYVTRAERRKLVEVDAEQNSI